MRAAFLVIVIVIECSFISYGQKTLLDNQSESYKRALDLFEKEKYVAAKSIFLDILYNAEYPNYIERNEAGYYAIQCAIELFSNDVELLGTQYFRLFPESHYINETLLRLGNFEYARKKYNQAIKYYSSINKDELSIDDKAECYFKNGYSWFLLDSLDKARKSFYEIKDIDTRYAAPATYYYAHIAYTQKNYETAISSFNKLKNDETFAKFVPYYITQCYYFQEKFDDLLGYAPTLIDSVIETRVGEMAKMIGDAYYRKSLFKEAIPYYVKYFEKGKDFKPDDYYQSGYCYYTQKDYSNAVALFEKASVGNTAVSQNANYLLGDCYIRLNNKDKALLAFSAAGNLDFDLSIKEDAAFNYAVLTFELSNSPFNSSIKALNDYIIKYPNSRRSDEAYKYLVTSCLSTHNYQEAITYLGKIKNKDNNIKQAYQRASFFRALELINNLQFPEALSFLELSLKYSEFDPLIEARSYYWTGDIHYRLNDIEAAIENYNLFEASKVAKKCSEYKIALYNIGYCWFNKHQYGIALEWFIKFTDNNKLKGNKLLADAYNRIGDCYFSDVKYKDAVSYYSKAIDLGLADKDYAIFQKAFTIGLQGDHNNKIKILQQILEMPDSKYTDDALFEVGRSYIALQKPEDAIKCFNKILSDFPMSSFVKKSLLQLGLIAYNAGKNIEAIDNYKKVVSDYPGTLEARSALTGIKNIYVELNEVDTYLKYTECLGDFANVSKSEQDSLLYYSAENLFTSSNWKRALESFNKYIEKFPEGNFILNAWYYKGECELKNLNNEQALLAFNYVINKPRNNFSETALIEAARINMDKKDFTTALSNYLILDSIAEIDENIIEARFGQVICNFSLGQFTETAEAAQRLQKTSGIPIEVDRKARYYLAKSYLAIGETDKALEQLGKIATDVKNEEGAEAKYLICESYLNQEKQEKAEKEIFNFIDLNSPHQYWMAKAFILLSKIYHNKKDDFQALNTLQSIISNYTIQNDGIIEEAKELKDNYSGVKEKKDLENNGSSGTDEEGESGY